MFFYELELFRYFSDWLSRLFFIINGTTLSATTLLTISIKNSESNCSLNPSMSSLTKAM